MQVRYQEEPLPVRAARRWARLPRAAVGAPSLAVPRARLDGAGSTLGCWEGSLPMAGGGTGWALGSLPTHTVL